MEEILASIKRIIEDTDNVRRPAEMEAETAEAAPVLDLPPADNDAADIAAFRDGLQQEVPAARDIGGLTAGPNAAPSADGFRPVHAPAPAHASALPLPAEPRPAESTAAAARPSIISDHAGRQVAAAFGELSDAFAASRKRSFDEIAEDMMRPMLQDWLDNNLPLLVERLVREEIERVARGGVR
ncbi:MAG: DUF2497 domain-containing protein [Rhizobiaceae bacterium]|nr:DUF2497 domain-containing protein [Rhizobiaceae bacterium]